MTDVVDLADRITSAVGFLDAAGEAVIEVTGADRIDYLHRIVSCAVADLPVGSGVDGLLLTAKGRIVADFRLAVLPERVLLLAPSAGHPEFGKGLAKFVIADDVDVTDRCDDSGVLSFVGPRAHAAATAVGGETVAALAENGAAEGVLDGQAVAWIRRSRIGLPAVDLVAPARALEALRERFAAAAEAEGGGPLSAEAHEILRVRAGVPALGLDHGEGTLPQEVGLGGHVSFTKGCFLGQEPVARLENRGHTNRGLVGLRLNGTLPVPGNPLIAGEKEVGHVTSVATAAHLALGLVRHEAAEPGTVLSTPSGDVVVVALPVAR